MYDRQWARSIVGNYTKLCTRTQQIDACIQQLYHETTNRNCLRADIQEILIDSVQGKCVSRVWVKYKQLCKRTPLDRKLLREIADTIIVKIDVDKFQRQFEFN